jgi:hypothetical protein
VGDVEFVWTDGAAVGAPTEQGLKVVAPLRGEASLAEKSAALSSVSVLNDII